MSEEVKQEESLKHKIESIDEKLKQIIPEPKDKTKPFKLKWTVRTKTRNLAKKDKLLVFLLKRNKGMLPLVIPYKDGKIEINGVPRSVEVDQIFLWEGKTPAIVQPEWDISPIGTMDYYQALEDGDRNSAAIKTLIAMLESKDYEVKKQQLGMMTYVIIGIIAMVIIGYLFFGGSPQWKPYFLMKKVL